MKVRSFICPFSMKEPIFTLVMSMRSRVTVRLRVAVSKLQLMLP